MEQKGTNMTDLLSASPKEKAIAYCLNFADPDGGGDYTDGQALKILESLSPEDKKEFFKWTRLYMVFAKIIPHFALVHREYTLALRDVEKVLNDLHSKELEIAHFNYIRASLPSETRADLDLSVGEIFNTDKIDPLTFKEVSLSIDPNRDPVYELSLTIEQAEKIGYLVGSMSYFVCIYSSYAKAVSQWIDQKKASSIVPRTLKNLLAGYKTRSYNSAVMDYYSLTGVNRARRNKEKVSKIRKQLAELLPRFREIEPDGKEVDSVTEHLNKTLNDAKKD